MLRLRRTRWRFATRFPRLEHGQDRGDQVGNQRFDYIADETADERWRFFGWMIGGGRVTVAASATGQDPAQQRTAHRRHSQCEHGMRIGRLPEIPAHLARRLRQRGFGVSGLAGQIFQLAVRRARLPRVRRRRARTGRVGDACVVHIFQSSGCARLYVCAPATTRPPG